jgi:hypothetical protein
MLTDEAGELNRYAPACPMRGPKSLEVLSSGAHEIVLSVVLVGVAKKDALRLRGKLLSNAKFDKISANHQRTGIDNMGVEAKAIVGVGLTFRHATEAGKWFLQNFAGTLSEEERELIDESFSEFIEASDRKNMPTWECLNLYSGDDFALYYPLTGSTAQGLRDSVESALSKWEAHFKDGPRFLREVQWF